MRSLLFILILISSFPAAASTPVITQVRDYIRRSATIENVDYSPTDRRILHLEASQADFVELFNATTKNCVAKVVGRDVIVSENPARSLVGPMSIRLGFVRAEVSNKVYTDTATGDSTLYYQAAKEIVVRAIGSTNNSFELNILNSTDGYFWRNDFQITGLMETDLESLKGSERTLKCKQTGYLPL